MSETPRTDRIKELLDAYLQASALEEVAKLEREMAAYAELVTATASALKTITKSLESVANDQAQLRSEAE